MRTPPASVELEERLTTLIAELGPQSACWLATAVGRRKTVVLAALHSGSFVMVGAGRSAKWAIEEIPAEVRALRDAVYQARRLGKLDPVEALELLLEPPPRVLAMLAEAAT